MAKAIGTGFLVLVATLGISWAVTGSDFFLYKYFAPKQAAMQRQVFENTPSYIEGKAEYLTRLRLEYQTADGGHKAALREMILSEASSVDNSKLPADLRAFVDQLKGEL